MRLIADGEPQASGATTLLKLPDCYGSVRVRTVSPLLPQDAVAEIVLTAVGIEADNASRPGMVVEIDTQGTDFQQARPGKPYVLIFDLDELICTRSDLSLIAHIGFSGIRAAAFGNIAAVDVVR